MLLAPVGTPEAIIQKTSVDLRKAMDDPEVKKKLAQLGAYLHPMTPAQVTAFSQEQQRTGARSRKRWPRTWRTGEMILRRR